MRFRVYILILKGLLVWKELISFFGRKRGYHVIGNRKLKIHTDLTKLPKADKVKAISLEGQGLQSFPAELYQYKNLEYLNLRNNNLTIIPEDINLFRDLYALYLDDNPIMHLPDSIVTLTDLTALSVEGTKISVFPEHFRKLNRLKGVLVGRMYNLKNEEIKRLEKEMPWTFITNSEE